MALAVIVRAATADMILYFVVNRRNNYLDEAVASWLQDMQR